MTPETTRTTTRAELLRGYPVPLTLTAGQVRDARGAGARQLVVLDDDPTGTQSVAGLPVLTRWSEDDLAWALETEARAVYVMTNSRSLDPAEAAARNREVAEGALRAAARSGRRVDFVSRSDSTLRGHFPLEPDVLSEVLTEAGTPADGVLVVPAFGDAGRITVGSVHYAGSDEAGFRPAGETEFAQDATFPYTSSDLRHWVAEKSGGRIPAPDVVPLTLDLVRGGTDRIADVLVGLSGGRVAVVDVVEETDLRALALGLLRAEAAGRRFIHRVGPPFVRALIGQDVPTPLTAADVSWIRTGGQAETSRHGLVVVGSHVSQTTRQLDVLRSRRSPAEVEIDVTTILGPDRAAHLDQVVTAVVGAMRTGTVVLRTSRTLVRGSDADSSLEIARSVSDAVVTAVRRTVDLVTPRFVVAKGGITSSDVASRGLGITRAMVRGPMLPGIVSLWEPVEGPAQGIPYVVFAGNVGSRESLADVVDTLSDPVTPKETT